MSSESHALRENSRELMRLSRVLEKLGETLAVVERDIRPEKLPANLIPMCRICARGDCSHGTIVDETMAKGCRCCEVGHERRDLG